MCGSFLLISFTNVSCVIILKVYDFLQIKSMKDMYFLDLNDKYQKIAARLHQVVYYIGPYHLYNYFHLSLTKLIESGSDTANL